MHDLARHLAFLVGVATLVDGLADLLWPHRWVRFWGSGGGAALVPRAIAGWAREYAGLSPAALRFIGLWKATAGAFLVWTARG